MFRDLLESITNQKNLVSLIKKYRQTDKNITHYRSSEKDVISWVVKLDDGIFVQYLGKSNMYNILIKGDEKEIKKEFTSISYGVSEAEESGFWFFKPHPKAAKDIMSALEELNDSLSIDDDKKYDKNFIK
jgi:hypothetical protein